MANQNKAIEKLKLYVNVKQMDTCLSANVLNGKKCKDVSYDFLKKQFEILFEQYKLAKAGIWAKDLIKNAHGEDKKNMIEYVKNGYHIKAIDDIIDTMM